MSGEWYVISPLTTHHSPFTKTHVHHHRSQWPVVRRLVAKGHAGAGDGGVTRLVATLGDEGGGNFTPAGSCRNRASSCSSWVVRRSSRLWGLEASSPPEVRGDIGPIDTSVPGIEFGELLPQTAKLVITLPCCGRW